MEQVMTDPVHDDDGRPGPLIIVAPGEYTCTVCGETTSEYYCYRCSDACYAEFLAMEALHA